jgi:hypothetical protein
VTEPASEPGPSDPTRGPSLTPVQTPALCGTHVMLRPVGPADYPYIQACELQDAVIASWRFRGTTPSPEQWSRTLWNDVLAQYLVMTPRSEMPIGLVLAYKPNFHDQHAYLAALRFDVRKKSPLMILGVGMFLRYLFTCWNFRKLYLDTAEYNYAEFASGLGRYFELEARLRQHFFFGGRHWDQLTLAIYRETWEELQGKLLGAERQPPTVRLNMSRARWGV